MLPIRVLDDPDGPELSDDGFWFATFSDSFSHHYCTSNMAKPAPVSEADIWLAKMNAGLNRSERVVQSWMRPGKSQVNGTSPQIANGSLDEEDFSALSGAGGIEIKGSAEEDATPGRKRLSDQNQKLLEHLLGKRAASAKMKEKKPHTSANGQTGSKPMPSKSEPKAAVPADDSEDDEEMGRASTFSSRDTGGRKVRDTKKPAYTTAGGEADVVLKPDVDPPDPREDPVTMKELIMQEKASEDEDEAEVPIQKKPAKRKATSYLDEMLAKKKSKAKKKADGKNSTAA